MIYSLDRSKTYSHLAYYLARQLAHPVSTQIEGNGAHHPDCQQVWAACKGPGGFGFWVTPQFNVDDDDDHQDALIARTVDHFVEESKFDPREAGIAEEFITQLFNVSGTWLPEVVLDDLTIQVIKELVGGQE